MKLAPLHLLLVIISLCSLAVAETLRVNVPEMECGGCTSSIKDRVSRENGVTKVETDIEKRAVTIVTTEGVVFTDDQVKALIKDAGFTAEKIERIASK
jgi:copper chaperone CopZ